MTEFVDISVISLNVDVYDIFFFVIVSITEVTQYWEGRECVLFYHYQVVKQDFI